MSRSPLPDKSDAPALTSIDLVKALRSDIIFGRLLPRERLVEEELCERFQVGRYAIRNVLDQLEKLGLVVRRPNRGATVNDLSIEEVDQLYEMRAVLQSEAIRRIPASVFPELAGRMETIQQEFVACLDANDLDGVAAADARFHHELYQACGNQYLSASIELHWQKTVCMHSYAFGIPALSRQSVAEHDKIIAATRSGQREGLTTLCNDHMLLSLGAYKRARGAALGREGE